MKSLPLTMIREMINGRIIQGTDNLIIRDIVTRIKSIGPNALLFDLHYDKQIHPHQCPKKFPYAIITDRPAAYAASGNNATLIRVADRQEAYWQLIESYRHLFAIPVIGVTGTCGKTTTKEMIKHILGERLRVNATYKSYNASFRNLGYLLDIDATTEAAVFEMGVAYPGDLKTACRYFKPQVGVITNIGVDHLQAFGSIDAYIKAKAEFLEGLGDQGTLILNADDPNIQKIDTRKFRGNLIYFGLDNRAHFKVSDIIAAKGVLTYSLRYQDQIYHFSVPGHGEFQIYNATAAIAAAHAVGINVAAAGARLASFRNVEKHFEFKAGINGSTIIDDTWSTNPTSARAALQLLKALARGKKTVAVLGKMALLGRSSAQYHCQTGEQVAELGIDRLVVIGEGAFEIGRGALQKGMLPEQVIFCQDSAETIQVLRQFLDQNSLALIKTSMMSSYTDLIEKLVVK